MKVVQVCYKYPPNYSGYGKQLSTINTKLYNINNDVSINILTSKINKNTSFISRTNNRIELKNEKKINLGSILLHKISYSFGVYFFAICVFFWLLLNKRKYQIIHCVKAGPEAALAVLASKITKKPVIVKIAQDELDKNELSRNSSFIKKKLRIIRNGLLMKADGYIAISKAIEERLLSIDIPTEKIIRIPNGVDSDKFKLVSNEDKTKIREKLKFDKDDLIFLFSGSISIRKGVFDLLASIRNLNQLPTKHKICFIFCGPIYDKEDYFFKELNKMNNKFNKIILRYEGEVDNINQYMQAADVVVLPSYSEGLPNVLLEASFSGCTILASNIDGNRDIIDHKINGLLFEKGDINALTKYIEYLVLDKQVIKQYSYQIYKKAIKNFEARTIAKKYLELYKSLSLEK